MHYNKQQLHYKELVLLYLCRFILSFRPFSRSSYLKYPKKIRHPDWYPWNFKWKKEGLPKTDKLRTHLCEIGTTDISIFWKRPSRWWPFIRTFKDWRWRLRRRDIHHSQFALINHVPCLLVELGNPDGKNFVTSHIVNRIQMKMQQQLAW